MISGVGWTKACSFQHSCIIHNGTVQLKSDMISVNPLPLYINLHLCIILRWEGKKRRLQCLGFTIVCSYRSFPLLPHVTSLYTLSAELVFVKQLLGH